MMMYVLWVLLMLAITAFAFWRGRSEERIASVVVLVLTSINPLVDLRAFGPRGIEWVAGGCDVIFLLMFGYFAIVRRLWWAVFAAGFQSIAIFIHAARLADMDIGRSAYIAAYQKYGYFVIGSLALGIWSRNWSAPSPSAPPAAPRPLS